MPKLFLRKINLNDTPYFARWWRDKELIALTSGDFSPLTDEKIAQYVGEMAKSKKDYHFMIEVGGKIIGHIALNKGRNNAHETQIIIGEKEYLGRGYGTEAIKLLLKKAEQIGIKDIYLEVRPENNRAIAAYKKSGFIEYQFKTYPKNKNLPKVLIMKLK